MGITLASRPGLVRTPESTPRSFMTCLDKIWDFFFECLRSVRINFKIFLQNVTSETRINIGSGDKGLRNFRIEIDAPTQPSESEVRSNQGTPRYHYHVSVYYTNQYTNFTLLSCPLIAHAVSLVRPSRRKKSASNNQTGSESDDEDCDEE